MSLKKTRPSSILAFFLRNGPLLTRKRTPAGDLEGLQVISLEYKFGESIEAALAQIQ